MGAIAPVTVNMEFQVPGFKYSCSIVKNLNCIIVYSDILNYKHVTKYIFFNGMIFCELFILKF